MAFTQKGRYVLKGNSLYDDYETNNKAEWLRIASESYRFTKNIYTDADRIRVDDVAPNLAEALEGNPAFRQVMKQRKQRGKFLYRLFADYILDSCWAEISQQGGATDG